MVALASPVAAAASATSHRVRWVVATGAVLLGGVGLRLALAGGGVGDRSAAVMIVLLGVSVWMGSLLLATPRTAFMITLGLVALLDLAALPPRNAPEYDDREAFYRTDQQLDAHVPVSSKVLSSAPALALLVEPTFTGAQPRFGLAGDAGDAGAAVLTWDCPFQHGLQRLVLPLPASVLAGAPSLDVRLHLTGSPSRESDYLLVYASSARGGFLVSLIGVADGGQGATMCALR